jgi:Cu/Ag efflux pump CusA
VPDQKTNKQILLRHVFLLILFLFLLNSAAMRFSWYWTIWWFDIPMHFLGGAFAVLLLNYLYLYTSLPNVLGKIASQAIFVVFGLVFISLGWEIFEFAIDRVGDIGPITLADSAKDLFFDFTGGAAAYFYLRYKELWRPKI